MDPTLAQKLSDLEEEALLDAVRRELAAGVPAAAILDACREGMLAVGKRYETGEYFVSDLMMAGEVFKQATALLGDQLKASDAPPKGVLVIGTVAGDIHDIGKDLVVTMLRTAGYQVVDLGVDVPTEKFVDAVKQSGATVAGLSGLLTVGYDSMRATVQALKATGLPIKVMIGGGPVNETVCEYTGADAFGQDAQAAVALADQWTQLKEVA